MGLRAVVLWSGILEWRHLVGVLVSRSLVVKCVAHLSRNRRGRGPRIHVHQPRHGQVVVRGLKARINPAFPHGARSHGPPRNPA